MIISCEFNIFPDDRQLLKKSGIPVANDLSTGLALSSNSFLPVYARIKICDLICTVLEEETEMDSGKSMPPYLQRYVLLLGEIGRWNF